MPARLGRPGRSRSPQNWRLIGIWHIRGGRFAAGVASGARGRNLATGASPAV